MNISKVISYVAVLVTAGALVFGAIYLRGIRAEQHDQVQAPVQAPWALHAAEVTQKTITSGFLALATKKADSEISIVPQITGTILSMGPREGQSFQPGTILARIDATQINDEIDAAEAKLRSAKQKEKFLKGELGRQNNLFAKGFTTSEKVDSTRTNFIDAKESVAALNHQLSQLKTRRSYAVITADKSGTVAARLAEPGNLAAPGNPIYKLTVSGITRFSVKVPQSVLDKLQVGGLIELDSGNKKVTTQITRINPTLDNLSMGSVDIDLAKSPFNLPAGARVPARVITSQIKDALAMPITAIAWAADGKSGFVIKVKGDADNSTLVKVPVKVIQASSESAAVKGDIKAGERVIIAQQAILFKLQTGDAAIIAEGMAQ